MPMGMIRGRGAAKITNDDLTELVDLIKESGRYLEERKTRLRQLKITVEYYLQQTEEETEKWKRNAKSGIGNE